MRLTFYGAAGEVTGSCTLVETGAARVLVDCGMFQGSPVAEARNRRPPRFDAQRLDAVVLTHAHLDHAGLLPMLVRDRKLGGGGYRGPIYATPASIELAGIILRDAAEIQQMNAARWSRSRQRRGQRTVEPIYDERDAEQALALMRPIDYRDVREIAPGIRIELIDAGHILGSASVRLRCKASGAERAIVFSGDIGMKGAPLLHDPETFDGADAVVLESTYGDRDHRPFPETVEEFASVLSLCNVGCGKLLIPAFAVGRTQNLIYLMGELRRAGRIPSYPVYIDSPMATESTELYKRHRSLFDTATWEIVNRGDSPLNFSGLRFTRTADESRRLNDASGPLAIIAASGMCTAGRIVHHLRHSLWKESTHVVFVGYQGAGTLGRVLVDGVKHVTIMHEKIAVKARIHTLGGFSAHAGQSGLVDWFRPLAGPKPRVFLNHGETRPRESLAGKLRADFGVTVDLPVRDQQFSL